MELCRVSRSPPTAPLNARLAVEGRSVKLMAQGLMVCAMVASVHSGAVLRGPGDGAQLAASAACSGTSRPGLGFA